MGESTHHLAHSTAEATFGAWLARRARGELDQSNRYIPVQVAANTDRMSKVADVKRRDELFLAVEQLYLAVLASGSPKKIQQIQNLLVALIGEQGRDALQSTTMEEEEVASTSVLTVAGQKAQAAHRTYLEKTGAPVDQRILQIISAFQFGRSVDKTTFEQVQHLMPEGVAFLGADVNFWAYVGNGTWQQQFKLERLNRDLTEQEFLELGQRMEQFYCHPESKEVRVLWDIGVVVLNGSVHEFQDQIEIVTKPLDPWLFWQFLLEARDTGLLYSTNPHFALIECLIAHDTITSLAIVSSEERRAGITLAQKRLRPSAAELAVIRDSITGNRPPRFPG